MILKPLCVFCREPLEVTTRDTASAESCPRCGVKISYDSPSTSPKAHDAIVAAVKEIPRMNGLQNSSLLNLYLRSPMPILRSLVWE